MIPNLSVLWVIFFVLSGIATASATLQAEVEGARKRLTAGAEALGQAAADRILGLRAS